MRVYFFMNFRNFGWFCKIKYTQNFILNSICRKKYTVIMQKKFIFLENRYTKRKKICTKRVGSFSCFLESIATGFPLWLSCLSVDLDRKIIQISLDSSVFFLFFFLLGWKLLTRNFQNFAFRKNKYSQNTRLGKINIWKN